MKKVYLGDSACVKKVFNIDEVKNYAAMSIDTNPVHVDSEYAAKTYFKKPIVQGVLVSSLFGGLLGSELPGKGTILLGQNSRFFKPVYVGEEVTAEIKIVKIREDKPIITFSTVCYKENGELAIEGEAVAYYKGEFFE